MKHSYTLSQQSEISSAVAFLEQTIENCPMICTLLCEELLSHLVAAGYRDISMCVRRFPRHCVEIRAAGEPDMLATASDRDETSRIEAEIRQSLLDQHAEHIDYRYSKGINRYRVFLDVPEDADLCDELYTFYQNADVDTQRKPLSLLIWLIRLHPLRFALSMFIKAVKHLGALMLPVFAANIIDAAISASSFFTWPVIAPWRAPSRWPSSASYKPFR